jgi:DNA mismatch repair protein MutL
MHDSYIVAADREGLVIVDQHAAHERVLYERNAEAMRGRGVESQLLVEPLPLELSPAQRVIFEGARAELERHGFVVEPFGGGTFLVRSVPAMAREADCRKLLLEIVEGLELEERTLDAERLGDRIAVNLACRAAIKVHTPLAPEKMQWLLDALARTRVPTHCPHGRPGILRFTLHEIERNFRRI